MEDIGKKRMYGLIYRIRHARKSGVQIITRERTILTPAAPESERRRAQINRLCDEYNFVVQFIIN
jgi:hypothetical protein